MNRERRGGPGRLMSIELASAFIQSGNVMCIAGDEQVLAQLPRGLWIGGTITDFISDQGGTSSRDHVFVDLLPPDCGAPVLSKYDISSLPQICVDAPENGFSLLVLPAFSEVHERFATDAPGYEHMYLRPLIGWVAGVHAEGRSKARAKTVFGPTGETAHNLAVAVHVPLPEGRKASVHLANPFNAGSGPVIRFPRGGFAAVGATIDGASVNFARYLADRGIDTRLPLVADYCGAKINVGVRSFDPQLGHVEFHAPVFEGIEYRSAEPLSSHAEALAGVVPRDRTAIAFSCSCMLDYTYGKLEGQRTQSLQGVAAFGQIAYQLVNQSSVYLRID